MRFRELLDEAIGDPPVSTVDVDRVITRQRRAGKLRRWGTCAAGAVAVLAVTLTAVRVLPEHRRPDPADEQPITTVAGTPEDMARLDNAVFAAVKRNVPGAKWVDNPALSHEGSDKNTLVNYFGQGGIIAGGVQSHFMVQVERYASRRSPGCGNVNGDCRETTGPRGEPIWTHIIAQEDGSIQRVGVLQPADDTMIDVTLMTDGEAKGIHALTLAQQTAIALDPAIVLAPVPPGVVVSPPPLPPSEPPRPSTAPTSPTPSPQADPAQQQRIDNAVFASLRRQAPSIQDPSVGWSGGGGDNNTDNYWGQTRITVDGVAGLFDVQIARTDPGFDGDLTCGKPSKTYACKAGTGPQGEKYRTVTNASEGRHVSVLRKDGSWLAVTLSADPPAGKFALTAAQQQAIAFDQAIALTAR